MLCTSETVGVYLSALSVETIIVLLVTRWDFIPTADTEDGFVFSGSQLLTFMSFVPT